MALKAPLRMRPKVLTKKPLIEAILELKWRPSVSTQTNGVDTDLRLFLGRFHDYVVKDYPSFEVLPSAAAPEQMAPNVALYRFRRSEGGWPLIQLGSGVLTLNETASYIWEDYRRSALDIADLLFQTYPGKLELSSLDLRYINAVNVDFEKQNVTSYLADKFKVQVSFPASLFETKIVEGAANLFALQVAFPTNNPRGSLRLSFGRGKANDKDAVVWETIIHSEERDVPHLRDELQQWLDSAHNLAEDCFFKLIHGELLERFS